MRTERKLYLAVMLCGVACSGWCAESATNRTTITAARLDYDYRRSIARFEGDVVVQDADVRITADAMTVLMTDKASIGSVTAVGNVHIEQAGREARCHKAIYQTDSGQLLLIGDAVLRQGRDEIRGAKITIWVGEERMISEPGAMVLYPRSGAPLTGGG